MALNVSDITIRLGNEDDFEKVVEIMNTNFHDAPFFAWIADDPDERSKLTREFFKLHMKLGLTKGTVNIAECADQGVVGAAIWSPKGTLDAVANSEIQQFAGAYAPRFQLLVDTFQEHYPPATTFEHLMWISVHPAVHGRGVGGKLLSYRLDELDRLGKPAYLEATTRLSARGAYERAGFQPIGEPIRLPRGVTGFPMWRNPRGPSDAPAAYRLEGDHETDKMTHFGGYRWWILDIRDGKALLLCDQVAEKRNYHERHEATTWADCSLRRYLNETFYTTFSEADRSRILETRLSNMNNPWFGTNGGRDTTDKIFILSIDEAVKYLGDSGQYKNKSPNSRYFINDDFNDVRKSVSSDSLPSSWWLRSPGNNPDFASCVTVEGRIAVSGDFVNRDYFFVGGFRPAIWISM
jgi:GNAT superfamily N-acetyltransferase